MLKTIALIASILLALPVQAEETAKPKRQPSEPIFKVRAREHYDHLSLNSGQSYKGFSHRFNLWWEKPMELSLGFVVGPVWAPLKSAEGEKVTLYNLGAEAKWFPVKSPVFLRTAINLNGLKDSSMHYGASTYLGSGIEVIAWGVGFALEYGIQVGEIETIGGFRMLSPSIGFHFYEYL